MEVRKYDDRTFCHGKAARTVLGSGGSEGGRRGLWDRAPGSEASVTCRSSGHLRAVQAPMVPAEATPPGLPGSDSRAEHSGSVTSKAGSPYVALGLPHSLTSSSLVLREAGGCSSAGHPTRSPSQPRRTRRGRFSRSFPTERGLDALRRSDSGGAERGARVRPPLCTGVGTGAEYSALLGLSFPL